jgi:bacillithiol system protein YtxJ
MFTPTPTPMPMQPMQQLNSPEEYEALRGLPMAFVYKHSTRCPISTMAFQEVAALNEEYPDVPVFVIDVVAERRLARYVAERTGITHHSPQIILLVHGEPAWSVTHFDVRADELSERLSVLAG